jgi:serine/threonine protein kinase
MSAGAVFTPEDFSIIKPIGEGTYSSVHLAKFKGEMRPGESEFLILKKISKARTQPYFIFAEKEAGKRLHHPHIVEMKASFEDADFVYVIQNYVKGLDLYKFFEQRSFEPLEEGRAKRLFKQLVSALSYSGKNSVSHRDLKLENIIISNPDTQDEKLTIIDFGLCGVDAESKVSDRWVGSPDYVAPEILLHEQYNPEKADTWSLGVLLFICLTGKLPFHKKKRYTMLRQKMHPEVTFPSDPSLSEEAKDLLRSLLQFHPEVRFDMREASQHEWFKDC